MPEVKITVRKNGPFRVEGPVELVDGDGNAYDLTGKPGISLCRCGQSIAFAQSRSVCVCGRRYTLDKDDCVREEP